MELTSQDASYYFNIAFSKKCYVVTCSNANTGTSHVGSSYASMEIYGVTKTGFKLYSDFYVSNRGKVIYLITIGY